MIRDLLRMLRGVDPRTVEKLEQFGVGHPERMPHVKPPLGMVPYLPTHNHAALAFCEHGCPVFDWTAHVARWGDPYPTVRRELFNVEVDRRQVVVLELTYDSSASLDVRARAELIHDGSARYAAAGANFRRAFESFGRFVDARLFIPTRKRSESYCSACEQWSPEVEWKEDDVYVDGDPVEAYAVCPRCRHHWPPNDPPMRDLKET